MGHLTFVSKRLSAVGSKRISQFFDSAREQAAFKGQSSCQFHVGFSVVVICIVVSWNMPLFNVWSEDKLNKKFVVAENFSAFVSIVALTCLEGGGFDPLQSSNCGAFDRLNRQQSGEFDQNFSKKSNAPGFPGGGDGRFWK